MSTNEMDPASGTDDFAGMAEAFADQARRFLSTTASIAAGSSPESAIPVLLLATSDVLASGARLGAMVDVVPEDRYEPDAGPDVDIDPLRMALAGIFDGIDHYPEIVDPVLGLEVGAASVSEDIAAIATALTQGLAHYDLGNCQEALWWWQFSYLSTWGERAASVLRILQLILGHLRLDVADDVAEEAQFEASQFEPARSGADG